MGKQPEVTTIDGAAGYLNLSRPTVYNLIGSGELEEVFIHGREPKSGRFRLVTMDSVRKACKTRGLPVPNGGD